MLLQRRDYMIIYNRWLLGSYFGVRTCDYKLLFEFLWFQSCYGCACMRISCSLNYLLVLLKLFPRWTTCFFYYWSWIWKAWWCLYRCSFIYIWALFYLNVYILITLHKSCSRRRMPMLCVVQEMISSCISRLLFAFTGTIRKFIV